MQGMLGIRADLSDTTTSPHFWVKLLFPFGIAAAGLLAVERLAGLGVRVGAAWLGLVVPVAAIWLLGLGQWFSAPVDASSALLCPELGMPFLAVWYVAGIALATLAGAALGPRLLRW